MRVLKVCCGAAVLALASCSGAEPQQVIEPVSGYNEALATELGADEYGMKPYVFVVLKTGSVEITDEDKRNEIFRGHFANMKKLAEAKKLVLAGPFIEGAPKRGLYIFNVTSIEEAKELVLTDPAVEAGIFDAEFTKYYGSAALMKVNSIHETLQKTKIE